MKYTNWSVLVTLLHLTGALALPVVEVRDSDPVDFNFLVDQKAGPGDPHIPDASTGAEFWGGLINRMHTQKHATGGNGECSTYEQVALVNGHEVTWRYLPGSDQGSTGSGLCESTATFAEDQQAVNDCANILADSQAFSGCCTFRHQGGDWFAFVQVTSKEMNTVEAIKCPAQP